RPHPVATALSGDDRRRRGGHHRRGDPGHRALAAIDPIRCPLEGEPLGMSTALGGMAWALFHDVAQRVISLNKLEQRRHLRERLGALALPEGALALDFGCGTGLFAPTFQAAGLRFVGYDIDP